MRFTYLNADNVHGDVLDYREGSCLTSDFCKGHYIVKYDGLPATYEICSHLVETADNHYVAGWNTPGYLPDNTPAIFDNTADAWEYLRYEADRCADEMAQMAEEGRTQLEQSIIDEVANLPEEGEDTVMVGGLAYFVQRVKAGQ